MEPVVFGEKLEGQVYKERRGVYGLVFNASNQIGVIKTERGYFLPGGGIEDDETHEQCVKREFIEETGHCIEVGDYIGCGILYGFAPTQRIYMKIIGYFYLVVLTGDILEKIEFDHDFTWKNPIATDFSVLLENQKWAIDVALHKIYPPC